jgi:hypothetical protein
VVLVQVLKEATQSGVPNYLGCQRVPTMRSAGIGTIVNVTSTANAVPLALIGYYFAAYPMSDSPVSSRRRTAASIRTSAADRA